jgi:hypothetical protein
MNQTETLKLKNTMTEQENSIELFNCRLQKYQSKIKTGHLRFPSQRKNYNEKNKEEWRKPTRIVGQL